MIRLSIQARQVIARLTLPVLILVSVAMMLVDRASPVFGERVRSTLSDALAPLYGAVEAPVNAVRGAMDNVAGLVTVRAENARLREENERLRHWYDVAVALDSENAALKANLHWMPDAPLSYVTARVVADAGGVYARSVLLATGPHSPIRKGQVALDASGLVGRVTEVGARSARVLLITDMNSRIPVMLEASRAHAILVGGNAPYPRLIYLPEGTHPAEGERVVTSAEAGAFPAGLLVGTVHYAANGGLELSPAADMDRLEIVRIFDYGLSVLSPAGTQAKEK